MYNYKNLLTIQNSKTQKGEKKGFLTGILYLKPADSGGGINLCPKSTTGCKLSCLNTAGRGRFDKIQQGRQRKTDALLADRNKFISSLDKEVKKLAIKARKLDMIPCVRINGTSDIPLLAREVAKLNPNVMHYDYTKIPKPYKRHTDNYHITFSKSEDNMLECIDALNNGINVAVVFEKELPDKYLGYEVISGDDDDLRFLDKKGKNGKGLIIGLKAKGRAKKDFSGFVIRQNKKEK